MSAAQRKDSKAEQPRKQEIPVLQVISKELEKLENMVESLDHAFKDLKNQASTRIQNETDLEKEQKYVCEAFSNLNIWQGEQRNLLIEVLSEMNSINSNLTTVLKDSKEDAQAKENKLSHLYEELEFLEKRYIRDVSYLKKRLLSQKIHTKEVHFSLRDIRKKLCEKEELVKSLTKMCDELRLSLTEVTNQKIELQASTQILQNELESKESAETVPSPVAVPNEEDLSNNVRISKEMQNKISKLEKRNHEYQQQLKILERKLKKSRTKALQLNIDHKNLKATIGVAEIEKRAAETLSHSQKVEEDLHLQIKQVSLLQVKLQEKNADIQVLMKENEELKLRFTSEVSLLRSELQRTSDSESALLSQLQHLKKSYAMVFSDSTFLDP